MVHIFGKRPVSSVRTAEENGGQNKPGTGGDGDVEKAALAAAPDPILQTSDVIASLAIEKLDTATVKEQDATNDEALAQLPQHDREVLEQQLYVPEAHPNFFSLYRYATRKDLLILAVSIACSIVGGALLPLMTVLFGRLSGTFQGFDQGNLGESKFNHDISQTSLNMVYLAIGEFVTIYIVRLHYTWKQTT